MTTGSLDIFVDKIDRRHCKAWFEISHDAYNAGFGYALCEIIYGNNPPKTPVELVEMLHVDRTYTNWHWGYNCPECGDKFNNANIGPYTIGRNGEWYPACCTFYRAVLNSKTGEWTVIAANDATQKKSLVERWRYSKTDAFKKAEQAKIEAEEKQQKALEQLLEDTDKFFEIEAKKRGIKTNNCCCF